MIYTKKIEEITWEDVDAFCEQATAEGAHLDYKQDFPQKNEDLAKTIAAMANTLGGVILIGVEEDKETTEPVLPIKGIELQRDLSVKVMNIILSNLTPYFIPEIQVCSKDEKAVVVIRIPQSHQAPHAINKSTMVYLRTGNRNTPEELANLEKVSWLQDQRRKSEELKEALYKQTEERFRNIYQNQFPLEGLFAVSLCPFYPKEPFRAPPGIKAIYDRIRVTGRPYLNDFPSYDNKGARIVQDGFVVSGSKEEIFHTELNCLGLYMYKELVSREFDAHGKTIKVMPASQIFYLLDRFTESARLYYDELPYSGPLDFYLSLDNIRQCSLGQYARRETISYCPDGRLFFRKDILTHSLEQERDDLILEAAQKIGWAFNYEVTKEILEACFREYGRAERRQI